MNLNEVLEIVDQYEHALPALPSLPVFPVGMQIAGWIDHTLLKPDATASQVRKLCDEARQYHFATVCVNPSYVALAAELLSGSGVGICAVTGFPLGATTPELKAYETRQVIDMGATEVDMVINIGALKSGDFELAFRDVKLVAQAAHEGQAHLKVILEMALLNQREKMIGCLLCKQAGADFVKTSTGFGPGGAVVEDVTLMRRIVGTDLGVKAAGGIRTFRDAQAMIAAGANRIGASASISILQEAVSGASE